MRGHFRRALLLWLFTLVLMQACRKKGGEDSQGIDNDTPIMTFRNISSIYSQDAIIRLKMRARLQYQYQNKDESYPEGIYVEFFDSLGTMITTLKADSGYRRISDNSYRVVGNVVVFNIKEQQKLETQVLNWDMEKQQIFTDTLTPVTITTPAERVKGNGLRAKQDFSEYEITGGVTGIFTLGNQ